jgi:hypothetical protein
VQFEKHKITIWRNGFRLDGGNFRPIADTKNQQFLVAISNEHIPPELLKPGIEIDLEVEDEMERDYPDQPGHPASRPKSPPAPAGQTTAIRFRFPDDSTKESTFGLAETIRDIRRRVGELRPDLRSRQFTLTVAPSGPPLLDDSVTVEGARLMRALINVSHA